MDSTRSLIIVLLVIGTMCPMGRGQDVQEWIFPIDLESFGPSDAHTSYFVRNIGPATNVEITYPSGGGRTDPIAANGVLVVPHFQDVVPQSYNGWSRLRVPLAAQVAARAEVSFTTRVGSNRTVTDVVSIPAVRPAIAFETLLANRVSRQSALAIVNPSPNREVTVRLVVIDISGGTICTGNIAILPLGRVTQFAREILPACEFPITSVLAFGADLPIAVMSADVLIPSGQLVSISAETVGRP